MVLADLGVKGVRVHCPSGLTMPSENRDLLHRGKRVVDLDVKTLSGVIDAGSQGRCIVRLFPAYTCKRFGIGPDEYAAINL